MPDFGEKLGRLLDNSIERRAEKGTLKTTNYSENKKEEEKACWDLLGAVIVLFGIGHFIAWCMGWA